MLSLSDISKIAEKWHVSSSSGKAPATMDMLFDGLSVVNSSLTLMRRAIFANATIRTGAAARIFSIGNISAGGTGKTPVVDSLVKTLGIENTVVLVRGYGGTAPAGVITEGEHISTGSIKEPVFLSDPATLSDEGMELARKNPGLIVIGGKYRADTARLAEQRYAPTSIILDDGLQYARLEKDVEFIMFDVKRPFPPRGLRRDLFSVIKKSDIIMLSGIDVSEIDKWRADSPVFQDIRDKVLTVSSNCVLASAVTRPVSLHPVSENVIAHGGHMLASDRHDDKAAAAFAPEMLRHRNIGAVCGIGKPDSFFRTLRGLDANMVFKHSWPDHCWHGIDDFQRLCVAASAAGAEMLVITSKDAARIMPGRMIKPGRWVLDRLKDTVIPVMELRTGLFVYSEQRI